MTQNPINALKIKIHKTKHTNNTKVHFPKSKQIERFIFSKNRFFLFKNVFEIVGQSRRIWSSATDNALLCF